MAYDCGATLYGQEPFVRSNVKFRQTRHPVPSAKVALKAVFLATRSVKQK